jgi:hypothetical protein
LFFSLFHLAAWNADVTTRNLTAIFSKEDEGHTQEWHQWFWELSVQGCPTLGHLFCIRDLGEREREREGERERERERKSRVVARRDLTA